MVMAAMLVCSIWGLVFFTVAALAEKLIPERVWVAAFRRLGVDDDADYQ
jgi:hypothetical protein